MFVAVAGALEPAAPSPPDWRVAAYQSTSRSACEHASHPLSALNFTFPLSPLSRVAGTKPVNAETLTPFDATTYKGSLRPGQHPDVKVETVEDAFSIHLTTQRLSPRGEFGAE